MMTGSAKTVRETNLPIKLLGRGKVRDIYAAGRDKLLIVASDRLSAFDCVLPNPIPYKGSVLTQISSFWFRFFEHVVPHHLITTDVTRMDLGADLLSRHASELEGRSMLVKRAEPFLIECVVRGYITGSGWNDYLKTGSVCGHRLPAGLKQCQKLPEPLFTPATKAASGHDENISIAEAAKIVGEQEVHRLKTLSIELYQKGAEYAEARGILMADTKFEFGLLNGEIILIDEVLTPDSSRFWPEAGYEPGHDQPSYDKQIVRNYLLELGWNKKPPVPELPEAVVDQTSSAYREIYQALTGKAIA